MKIKLKHHHRKLQHDPNRTVIVVHSIPCMREQDMDLSTPVIQFIADNFNADSVSLHHLGAGLIPISVPWPSTEVRDVLPETTVELSWDQSEVLHALAAIRGMALPGDLRPQMLIVTVTYSDGKVYGSILEPASD